VYGGARRGYVLILILKEVAVNVAYVNQLDVGGLRTEIEGSDFDRADERWPGCALKLFVEDIYERGSEGGVELVPIEVDGHAE